MLLLKHYYKLLEKHSCSWGIPETTRKMGLTVNPSISSTEMMLTSQHETLLKEQHGSVDTQSKASNASKKGAAVAT